MATKPVPLGTQIDEIWQQREIKRKLEKDVEQLGENISKLEEALLRRLDAEKMDKGTGQKATVSISTTVKANIVDWDAMCKYIKKTGSFQLLQRRVSDLAAREFFEKNKAVPGLEPFTLRKINIRTLAAKP